jgi:hypothetical protein
MTGRACLPVDAVVGVVDLSYPGPPFGWDTEHRVVYVLSSMRGLRASNARPLADCVRLMRRWKHRMDRNYLKGREGDRINAVLAAAGYNFSLLLRWLAALLRALIAGTVCHTNRSSHRSKSPSLRVFHGRRTRSVVR